VTASICELFCVVFVFVFVVGRGGGEGFESGCGQHFFFVSFLIGKFRVVIDVRC
jgi:hypothetical protein